MRRTSLLILFALIAVLCLGGCAGAGKSVPSTAAAAGPQPIDTTGMIPKVENFQVIVDTSESMWDKVSWTQYAGNEKRYTTKLEYQKYLVTLFNDLIPNLKLNAGLRDFAGKYYFNRPFDTKLYSGMVPYNRAAFGNVVYTVNLNGVISPLNKALDEATQDIKPLQGQTAVIIFTDGLDMSPAIASAQAMKAALGDKVCIYAVQIDKDPRGKALLDQVVKAGACGSLVAGEQVATVAGMTEFVKSIFLQPAPPAPPAAAVTAPPAAAAPAAAPAAVPAQFPDKSDKLGVVYFDFDKSNIKTEFRAVLEKNAAWLKANKDYTVRIEGNCDERGTSEYNLALGQRRADAAAKYLQTLGIDAKRINTVSYGKEKPGCKESNEGCWAKNRNATFIELKGK